MMVEMLIHLHLEEVVMVEMLILLHQEEVVMMVVKTYRLYQEEINYSIHHLFQEEMIIFHPSQDLSNQPS